MQPKSTVQNSLPWRLWHGINYMIGGISFIIGSFALFSFMADYMDNAAVSAWFYTIGSTTFLLADITQWLHYLHKNCPFFWIAVNFFGSLTGSTFYLIGSMQFLPFINQISLGNLFFIIGSAFIFLSQFWKEIRTLSQQDISGFHVDLFAGLGGLMYFIGTFVLEKAADDPDYTVPGVIIYCLGGVFFTVSGLFMQKRYFFEGGEREHGLEYSLAKTSSI